MSKDSESSSTSEMYPPIKSQKLLSGISTKESTSSPFKKVHKIPNLEKGFQSSTIHELAQKMNISPSEFNLSDDEFGKEIEELKSYFAIDRNPSPLESLLKNKDYFPFKFHQQARAHQDEINEDMFDMNFSNGFREELYCGHSLPTYQTFMKVFKPCYHRRYLEEKWFSNPHFKRKNKK